MEGKTPVCHAYGCKFNKEDHPPGTMIKHPKRSDEREYYKQWD